MGETIRGWHYLGAVYCLGRWVVQSFPVVVIPVYAALKT